MFSIIADLGKTIIEGVTGHFKRKQQLKQAVTDNKIRMAQSEQSHNHDWEMKALEGAGWKDDVLFYAFIGMFVWAGIDPDGAQKFFENLSVLPDWFVKTWLWIVASILGVKKIGDYLPNLIKTVKDAAGRGGGNP